MAETLTDTQRPTDLSLSTGTASREQRGPEHAGRLRDLRDHRRPREGDDLPLAVPAGERAACSTARSSASPSTTGRVDAAASSTRASRSSARGETLDEDGLRPPRRPAVLRARRLRRRGDLRARRRGDRGRRAPVFYLEIPPFLFGTVVKGLARGRPDEDRARRRGEAVRPRPRVGARAGRRAAPVHRRVAALPDRPLPRQDGHSRRSSTSGSPTRCSSRSGTATTSTASRSRWPRTSASRIAATSTTRSARCVTWSSTI